MLLPTDVVVSSDFAADTPSRIVDVSCIESGWRIMDIGPGTDQAVRERGLHDAGTVLWNGTMGVFEYRVPSLPVQNGSQRH